MWWERVCVCTLSLNDMCMYLLHTSEKKLVSYLGVSARKMFWYQSQAMLLSAQRGLIIPNSPDFAHLSRCRGYVPSSLLAPPGDEASGMLNRAADRASLGLFFRRSSEDQIGSARAGSSIGPRSLKRSPRYISLWISHGGGLIRKERGPTEWLARGRLAATGTGGKWGGESEWRAELTFHVADTAEESAFINLHRTFLYFDNENETTHPAPCQRPTLR